MLICAKPNVKDARGHRTARRSNFPERTGASAAWGDGCRLWFDVSGAEALIGAFLHFAARINKLNRVAGLLMDRDPRLGSRRNVIGESSSNNQTPIQIVRRYASGFRAAREPDCVGRRSAWTRSCISPNPFNESFFMAARFEAGVSFDRGRQAARAHGSRHNTSAAGQCDCPNKKANGAFRWCHFTDRLPPETQVPRSCCCWAVASWLLIGLIPI